MIHKQQRAVQAPAPRIVPAHRPRAHVRIVPASHGQGQGIDHAVRQERLPRIIPQNNAPRQLPFRAPITRRGEPWGRQHHEAEEQHHDESRHQWTPLAKPEFRGQLT